LTAGADEGQYQGSPPPPAPGLEDVQSHPAQRKPEKNSCSYHFRPPQQMGWIKTGESGQDIPPFGKGANYFLKTL